MFKKWSILAIMVIFITNLSAQNLQLHWDMLSERNYPTVTFEMFKADKLGDTFMFVDMDFVEFKDMNMAYMEIRRNFNLGSLPLQLGIEYNGGLWSSSEAALGGEIRNCWLAGATYPFALGNSFFTATLSYKHIMRTRQAANAQFTATWSVPIWRDKVAFLGFMDIWSEGEMLGDGRKLVFMAEPQLWYNFTQHFALGTEVELSQNFVIGEKAFKVFPTIGAKWEF